MFNRVRRITATICLAALLAGITVPLSASAGEKFINSSGSEANNMTSPVMVDLLLLRPVGLLTMCISTIFFVFPVLPLTLMTRPSELATPWEIMVLEPARFVWSHPLGTH